MCRNNDDKNGRFSGKSRSIFVSAWAGLKASTKAISQQYRLRRTKSTARSMLVVAGEGGGGGEGERGGGERRG